MSPDAVNGLFEGVAGLMIGLNCRRVLVDRKVRGVSLWPTVFMFSWGVWNLYYYPYLGQFWSFAGGIAVVVSNLAYACLMIRFGRES